MRTGWKAAWVLMVLGMCFSGLASAENEVGAIVAVKNKAVIEREKRELEAKAKDGILSIDTVTTLEASRAKMLFRDDSVLTLGEKSKLVVKEYMYSDGRRGKSVFNLIDGKLRTVVGNTDLEIHTPTSVTAARGTVILSETWVKGGEQCKLKTDAGEKFSPDSGCKLCATIVSKEGDVEVRNIDENVKGDVQLQRGWKTDVCEGEPPSQPEPAPASLMDRLSSDTDVGFHEITVPEPVETALVSSPDTGTGAPETLPPIAQHLPVEPPIDQQPPTTSPVSVQVVFP
ncbi:MAG: FecR domain-containing protein [Nitrospirae bacterium]|nr:FecR domain-containing protein [Nitrospirota bacterium]